MQKAFSVVNNYTSTWTLTGILGNLVSNHSNLSKKALTMSPIVMLLPPPAFTSISCRTKQN